LDEVSGRMKCVLVLLQQTAYSVSDSPGCDTLELVFSRAYGGLSLWFVDLLISPTVRMRLLN